LQEHLGATLAARLTIVRAMARKIPFSWDEPAIKQFSESRLPNLF